MAAADFLGVIKNASMGAFKTRDVFVYESALVITTGDSLSPWVRAFSHEFGPLGTLIFSGWVQRIDERRTARGRLAPEEPLRSGPAAM